MKKLAAFILILVYFIVSTGFVVSVHYCMNKVDSVSLGDLHKEECGKCGMHIEDSKGCCKDDVKLVKMHGDPAFAKLVTADFSLALAAPLHTTVYSVPIKKSTQEKHPLAHGPPLSEKDIYIQNCVFRL